jgi:hypothetical protein
VRHKTNLPLTNAPALPQADPMHAMRVRRDSGDGGDGRRPRVHIGCRRFRIPILPGRLAIREKPRFAGCLPTLLYSAQPPGFSDKEEVPGSSPGSPIFWQIATR